MKLGARDTASLFTPTTHFRAALFFGPDEGLIRERRKALLGILLGKDFDPLCVTELEEGRLIEDPASLADALSSFSLLADKSVITLRTSSDKTVSAIEDALSLPSCQNFLIVTATGDLPPRSGLRKFFETNKAVASLGCYPDEARDLEQILRAELQKRQITFDRDAVMALTAQLGNDRAVTLNEIEKIDSYLGEERVLTRDIVLLLTGGNDKVVVDDLCRYVASGLTSPALSLCNRLFSEGDNPISLIRSLSYYFEKLLSVKFQLSDGKNMNEALGAIRPPLFFKQKASFESHLRRFSLGKIKDILFVLTQTEVQCKRTQDPYTLLLDTVQKISTARL